MQSFLVSFSFCRSKFIAVGQNISQPFITVTMNYRLGLLGFMASSDLAELAGIDPVTGLENQTSSNSNSNVRLNRGYLDVEEAIRWTSENIDSWGGDPNRSVFCVDVAVFFDPSLTFALTIVSHHSPFPPTLFRMTIYGQSAGANNIVAQILASTGSPPKQITSSTALRQRTLPKPLKPLFRSAILQSPPLVPMIPPDFKDFQFSRVLEATNCSASTTPAERVDCLRSLSWRQISQVSTTESVLSSPSNRTLTPLGELQ